MAYHAGGQNVSYQALPLSHEERGHSPAPSGDLQGSAYHTPTITPTELHPDIPPGARFLGPALYGEQGSFRDSYASSSLHSFSGSRSDYNASLYALDPSGGYQDDPHASYQPGQFPMMAMSPGSPSERNRFLEEKQVAYTAPREQSKRRFFTFAVIAGVLLLILAVAIPVYLFVIKPSPTKSATAASKTGSAASTPTGTKSGTLAVTGGDGSTISTEDGTTFTYHNKFGGHWYYDENDPFNNGARAQSWSPALNETFRYGIDQIRGVNIGGWLVTEPFITPALFQKYSSNPTPPMDEWTLSEAMRADSSGGGINQLEAHYKTFITEKDFAEIAAAGLNYVRIPLGYWAVETRDNEQFLSKISWTYFLKAIKWARKYGLRINLDLHALPGSQNGWNHSGRLGTIGFLNGPMGYVNAQRALDYIRILAEFISQPQYRDVVTMFGIMNEPAGGTFGKENLSRFYLEAYRIIRNAGGAGTGNGPFISIHDGFFPRSEWANIFPNADRFALDTHPYLAFGTQSAGAMSSFTDTPCTSWASGVNESMSAFGLTTAGEWSNAVNDCGLFLNNVGAGTRYEGTYTGTTTRVGSCDPWLNWQNYDDTMKTSIRQFALSSMDALQNYFFWTWKIGNSTSGRVETPAWSYQLGLQHGWMPTDPRDAVGACGNTDPWSPPLQAWQTGGTGANNIPSTVSSRFAWPPTSISQAGAVTSLPSYTPTGPIPTLPVPTFTAKKSINAGNGWANPSDATRMHVPIATCTYLDPWVDPGTTPPDTCGSAARRAVDPLITLPPSP